MRQIAPGELAGLLDGGSPPLLLDVREPWELEICRIDGAATLPMRHVPSSVDDLDRDRETVIICHHGIRSRQVVLYLEHMGFANLINLEGGLAAWARDVDPSMPTY